MTTLTDSPVAGTPEVSGFNPNTDFSFQVTQTPLVVSNPTSSVLTVDDLQITVVEGDGTDTNFQITTFTTLVAGPVTMSLDPSTTPNCCTLNPATGQVSRFEVDGFAVVNMSALSGTRQYSQEVYRQGASSTTTVTGLVFTSVAQGILSEAEALISDLTPGGSLTPSTAVQNRFSVNNGSTSAPVMTLNPAFFLADVDMSWSAAAASPLNGSSWPAALVSQRHLICAQHIGGWPATYVFVDAAGETHVANSVNTSYVDVADTDIAIIYLDRTLPASCIPVSVLPSTWKNFLPSVLSYGTYNGVVPNNALWPLPVFLDGNFGAYVCINGLAGYEVGAVAAGGYQGGNSLCISTPSTPFSGWTSGPQPFASSRPAFTVLDLAGSLTPILLGMHWANSTATEPYMLFPCLSDYLTQIEACMNSFVNAADPLLPSSGGAGYSLKTVNLEGFSSW